MAADTTTEAVDFEALVARMRDAQKRYFKTRDPQALREAWKLEREVDHYLEERKNGMDLFAN